jgi:clan AA aspartic protease (TIGR02281 family)
MSRPTVGSSGAFDLAATLSLALAGVVALALAGAVALALAEPRIIGRTEKGVRILRGATSDTTARAGAPAGSRGTTGATGATGTVGTSGATVETPSRNAVTTIVGSPGSELLSEAPPLATSEKARALATRLVRGYGGGNALEAWTSRGERRGTHQVLIPARVTARVVDRRDGQRVRFDFDAAGYAVSVARTPDGSWQSAFGLVSELPPAQLEELEIAAAHDERLLASVAKGALSARVVREDGRDALLVWGPRGSATLFVPDRTRDEVREIRFRDRAPLRDVMVLQRMTFEDYRELEPEGPPGARGPTGTRVPFLARREIDGQLVEELRLETVDLLAAIEDTVFDRPGAVSLNPGGPALRVTVTLERRGGHHFVPVSVNGGPPRRFLLDTGAGMTVISQELAKTLDLGLADTVGVVGAGGGIEGRATNLASLALGGLVRQNVPALVLDTREFQSATGLPVDGILGFTALNRYAVTLDFERGQLELAQNASPHRTGAHGARVPLEFLGAQTSVPVRIDGGEPVLFVVDLGSAQTFVPAALGKSLKAARRLPGIPVLGADGRALEAVALRVRSLGVGSVQVPRPVVIYVTRGGALDPIGITPGASARGILGANFLTRFRVTLDYPRGELVLEPRRDRAADLEGDFVGTGIVPGPSGNGFRVSAVVEGSPAARLGVQVGETIVTVDGRAVAGLSATQLLARLGGPTGSSVRVVLERARGARRTLTLERSLLI